VTPAVRQHIARVIKDLVSRYSVAGIILDDYFYPYPSRGHPRGTFPDGTTYAQYRANGGKLGIDDLAPAQCRSADRKFTRSRQGSATACALWSESFRNLHYRSTSKRTCRTRPISRSLCRSSEMDEGRAGLIICPLNFIGGTAVPKATRHCCNGGAAVRRIHTKYRFSRVSLWNGSAVATVGRPARSPTSLVWSARSNHDQKEVSSCGISDPLSANQKGIAKVIAAAR